MVGGGCALLSPEGTWEVLPHHLSVQDMQWDVFHQGGVHDVTLKPGIKMYWSSGSWESTPVNDCASLLAGQHIKGTVLIVAAALAQLQEMQQLLPASLLEHDATSLPRPCPPTRHAPEPPVPGTAKQQRQQGKQSDAGQGPEERGCSSGPGRDTSTAHSSANGSPTHGLLSRLLTSRNGCLDNTAAHGDSGAAGVTLTQQLKRCRSLSDLLAPPHTTPNLLLPCTHLCTAAPTVPLPSMYEAAGSTSPLGRQKTGSAATTGTALQREHPHVKQAAQQQPGACSEPAPAPAPAPPAPVLPRWQDLPAGVVVLLGLALPDAASCLAPLAATCWAWRRALLQDDVILKRTWFNLHLGRVLKTQPAQPSIHPHATPQLPADVARQERPRFLLGLRSGCQHGRQGSHTHRPHTSHFAAAAVDSWPCLPFGPEALPRRLPELLTEAARVRNVSAMGVLAQLYEMAGDQAEANRWWLRSAKAGDLEGMLKSGFATYERAAGMEPDADGAFMWLSKALKKVLAVNSLSQVQVDGQCQATQQLQEGADAAAAECCSRRVCLALQIPLAQVLLGQARTLLHMIGRAGVVLGYLHMDGEGTRVDTSEAIRLFKLAAACGSREGSRVLGWMWNTGQY